MSTHKELQAIADFDHPFIVADDGSLSDAVGVYAPEVWNLNSETETNDIDIMGNGWEALRGYTGQYGYNGAVMHASEYIGGGLADDILATPGTYVAVVVYAQCECEPHVTHMSGFGTTLYCDTEQNAYCNFECECGAEDEPAGWAILRQVVS